MDKKLPIIIDVDTGIDDALALIMAFSSNKLDIKLITTVAGNVDLLTATQNTLYVTQKFAKQNIKVCSGAERPLSGKQVFAKHVHGKGGLGNQQFKRQMLDLKGDAVMQIAEILRGGAEPITIVGLGAMTNLAGLVTLHPELTHKIKAFYLMCGSVSGKGNITDYAEFNAYADAEALKIVLNSGVKVVLSPQELGVQTSLPNELFLCKNTSMREQFVHNLIEGSNETVTDNKFCLHDPNTINALLSPRLYSYFRADVTVETEGKMRGQTHIVKNARGKIWVQQIKDLQKTKQDLFNKIYGEK